MEKLSSERVKLKFATCQRIDEEFPGATKSHEGVVQGRTRWCKEGAEACYRLDLSPEADGIERSWEAG